MVDKWVIVGCGGHARSVADVILYNTPEAKIIFLDKNAQENETVLGFPALKMFEITTEKVIVGVGDNKKRKELSQKYYSNLASVISKNAYIGKDATIGKGVFVAHRAHIGVLSTVGDFSIINTGALIDHECSIAKASFIGPNATLCGNVKIDENVFIGAGTTIKDNIYINSDIVVGAGSCVVKNLEKRGTYIGCPARLLEVKSENCSNT